MYTSDIPEYEIDLALPERERWREVIQNEAHIARRLAKDALEHVEQTTLLGYLPRGISRTLIGAGGQIAGKLYSALGGRYRGEIESWAEPLGVSVGVATLLNCSYELWSLCTAGVWRSKRHGMVHVRSMDWPLRTIGKATRLFRFRGGQHEFVVVGVAGHVGVVSGMVPGHYSVTINYAPPDGLGVSDWGPAFLLREVLETCRTYDDAVSVLHKTELAASVFFTVCGAKAGQGCVIERTRKDSAVRRMQGDVLVQANHHVARKFRANNEQMKTFDPGEESPLEFSTERARVLQEGLVALGANAALDDAAACLDVEPVFNEHSYQQMLFVPKTGEVRAWRWT